MRKVCPDCRSQVGKRRAGRVKQRIEAGRLNASGRKKAMISTVFTVPPDLRERFRDKKLWRKAVREMWRFLEIYCGAKFGVECSHNVGEDGSTFHPHANFLWIQRDGYRPFIDPAALRSHWGKYVLKTYLVVDVHTSYTKPEAVREEAHRFKYVTRVMSDPDSWIGAMRWYGDYPKVDYKEEPAECPKCHGLFLWIGIAQEEDYLLQESEVDSS